MLIILILSLGYSCGKHGDVNQDPLVGEWLWVMQTDASVINGPPYDTLTPANTGVTHLLSLYPNHMYGMVTLRSGNQRQIENGNYGMKEVLTPGGPIKLLNFVHNGVDSLVNHTISHDSLFISYPHFTGKYTVNVYVRTLPI